MKQGSCIHRLMKNRCVQVGKGIHHARRCAAQTRLLGPATQAKTLAGGGWTLGEQHMFGDNTAPASLLAMKPCLYKGWVYKPLIQEQTSSTVHDDKGLKVWLGLGLEEGSILQQRSHATVFHPDPDRDWHLELGQFATRRGSRLPTNACECGYYASTRPH